MPLLGFTEHTRVANSGLTHRIKHMLLYFFDHNCTTISLLGSFTNNNIFHASTMPSPVEQALITLVPSLNTLPPELINNATALISQSKAKAPNLKPDEEIARTYTCAHIACERLELDRFFDCIDHN